MLSTMSYTLLKKAGLTSLIVTSLAVFTAPAQAESERSQTGITATEIQNLFVSDQTNQPEALQAWTKSGLVYPGNYLYLYGFSDEYYRRVSTFSGGHYNVGIPAIGIQETATQNGDHAFCGSNPADPDVKTVCRAEPTGALVKDSSKIKSISPSFSSNDSLSFDENSTFASAKARCDSSGLCDAQMVKTDEGDDVLAITIKKSLKI